MLHRTEQRRSWIFIRAPGWAVPLLWIPNPNGTDRRWDPEPVGTRVSCSTKCPEGMTRSWAPAGHRAGEEHILFHEVGGSSLCICDGWAASEAARALRDQLPAAFLGFFSPYEKLALRLFQPAPALKDLTLFLACQINTPMYKRSSTKAGKLARAGRNACRRGSVCHIDTHTKLH